MRGLRGFTVFALMLSMFALTTPRAFACSCVRVDYAAPEYLAKMDVVFIGRVIEIRDNPLARAYGAADDKIVTLFARKGYKGLDDAVVDVVTNLSSASCGIEFAVGREYLIFATREGERLTTNLCLGTQPLESASDLLPKLAQYNPALPPVNSLPPLVIPARRNAVWNCRRNFACEFTFRAACENFRAASGLVVFCR